MTGGLEIWSTIDKVFVWHWPLTYEDAWSPFILFLMWVMIPVAFAWLVSFVISWLERASTHDDHAA
jgi:hypothetical protein